MNPRKVILNDREVLINTDFRAWINFERLLQDENLMIYNETTGKELLDLPVILHAVKLIYVDSISIDEIQPAFELSMLFYSCGQVIQTDEKSSEKNPKKVYCFKQDLNYLKASFMEVYRFDPWEEEYLHWWNFKAYFDGLFGLNFRNILEIRQTDLKGYKGKALVNLRKQKERFAIKTKENKQISKYNKELDDLLINGGSAEDFKKLLGGNENE